MHGWEMPGAHESDCHDAIPISSNSVKCLELPTGPLEGTAKHHALEKQAGFSYCQVLGELIYAYVICHLDIGYASTFLSCFASSPTLEHYMALKNVIKYLCATMHWVLSIGRNLPWNAFLWSLLNIHTWILPFPNSLFMISFVLLDTWMLPMLLISRPITSSLGMPSVLLVVLSPTSPNYRQLSPLPALRVNLLLVFLLQRLPSTFVWSYSTSVLHKPSLHLFIWTTRPPSQ